MDAPEKEQDAAWLICLAREIVAKHFIAEMDAVDTLDSAEIDATIWQENNLDPSLLSVILEKSKEQFESSKDILLN